MLLIAADVFVFLPKDNVVSCRTAPLEARHRYMHTDCEFGYSSSTLALRHLNAIALCITTCLCGF